MKRDYSRHSQVRYADVEELQRRIGAETPKSGDYLYDYRLEVIKNENANLSEEQLARKLKISFRDLPISAETLKTLSKRRFNKLTEVQRCVIPHALAGRDVMAASKTGSGKTLAYLLPIVENLYRQKWTVMDRVGALILVPTRELAVQVFEVLRSLLEESHELSFGLLIGGKSLASEQSRVSTMNILVATPGRLLQHLQETELFDLENLQMLVLDEADEILSLGFQEPLEEILDAVPRQAQTLLFSATLSKSLLGLSRITLREPENVLLSEKGQGGAAKTSLANMYEMPVGLTQYCMMVPHEEKVDVLFSFFRSHKHAKMVVFASCCKQVRFIYESFKKLRLGLPIFELHGRQKQPKRMAIFFTFAEKRQAVLITTNVSARGLDFPKVDWVVQLDAPEDVETYVHRVGRTARLASTGKSLLLLDPSEHLFAKKVEATGAKLQVIRPNPAKQLTIRASLQVLCSEDAELKYLAQRAFISFVSYVARMPDKETFSVANIKAKPLAESYGLIQTPVIKIDGVPLDGEERVQKSAVKNRIAKKTSNENENEEEEGVEENYDGVVLKPQDADENEEEENGQVKNKPSVAQDKNLSKNQRKLMKFKDKLRQKKQNDDPSASTQTNIDTALLKNVGNKLNQTRETQHVSRIHKITENEPEDDGFMLIKRRDHEIDVNNIESDEWKTSKRQLKKIKSDGVFGGKNVFDIDENNNLVSQAETNQKQFRDNLSRLEQSSVNPIDIYATKLAENQTMDKDLALLKIKEKRSKEKAAKKLRIEDNRNQFYNKAD